MCRGGEDHWKKRKGKRTKEKAAKEGPEEGFPTANLQVFLAGLYTQTLMALGEIESPVSGKKEERLDEARYLIDTIDLLREKTRGNLTPEESKYLDNLLYDLRMRYVGSSKEPPAEQGAAAQ